MQSEHTHTQNDEKKKEKNEKEMKGKIKTNREKKEGTSAVYSLLCLPANVCVGCCPKPLLFVQSNTDYCA